MSDRRIMILSVLGVIAIMLLAGCDNGVRAVDTVQVDVPIYKRTEAPSELLDFKMDRKRMPIFVAPSDPMATSCLTAKSEPDLRDLILSLTSQIDTWSQWAH